jgi:hypothetical protein
VLYSFMALSDAGNVVSPAKRAWTFQPEAAVSGDAPFAVKVPSLFVITPSAGRLSAPVPLNVIILPPTPFPSLAMDNLPVTVTSSPAGTFSIVLSVKTVWI